jgi:hypothetical protein
LSFTGSLSSGGLGTALGDVGGAVASIFQGIGDQEAASTYNEAAAIEGQAATFAGEGVNLVKQSAAIQTAQTQREINSTIGQQQGGVSGAGLKGGGSNAYLLKSSVQQGALATGLVNQNAAIQETGFQEQQEALLAQQTTDQGLAQQANTAATGSFIGAAFKGIAGAGALFGL